MCFQRLRFGLARAIRNSEGGRRAEDPFRGLRAGPARSSPRLLPPPTPKNHTQWTIPIGGSTPSYPLQILEMWYVKILSALHVYLARGLLPVLPEAEALSTRGLFSEARFVERRRRFQFRTGWDFFAARKRKREAAFHAWSRNLTSFPIGGCYTLSDATFLADLPGINRPSG
jgi:hypothetical protein